MVQSAATVFLLLWALQSHQQVTMQSWDACVKAAESLAPHFERAVCLTDNGDTYVGGRKR